MFRFLCKHDWEVIHSEKTISKFREFFEVINRQNATGNKVPWQMADSTVKYIQLCKCTKCGILRKYVTEN